MKNRYKVLAAAAEHGIPVKKQLKTWVRGELVVLEVDRPLDEICEDLRELGLTA